MKYNGIPSVVAEFARIQAELCIVAEVALIPTKPLARFSYVSSVV
jgi:hypothetical protein